MARTVSARLGEEVYTRLRLAAEREGLTISQLLKRLILEYLGRGGSRLGRVEEALRKLEERVAALEEEVSSLRRW